MVNNCTVGVYLCILSPSRGLLPKPQGVSFAISNDPCPSESPLPKPQGQPISSTNLRTPRPNRSLLRTAPMVISAQTEKRLAHHMVALSWSDQKLGGAQFVSVCDQYFPGSRVLICRLSQLFIFCFESVRNRCPSPGLIAC